MTMNCLSRAAYNSTLAATLLLPAVLVTYSPTANAQQQPTVRSLTGTVTEKAGGAVKGAVVHLKDTKSLSQRSYITADDGTYKFNQLSTSTDYQVWADVSGKKSDVKSLSSFDNKPAAKIDLKMP
jgi:hypothetical protein